MTILTKIFTIRNLHALNCSGSHKQRNSTLFTNLKAILSSFFAAILLTALPVTHFVTLLFNSLNVRMS